MRVFCMSIALTSAMASTYECSLGGLLGVLQQEKVTVTNYFAKWQQHTEDARALIYKYLDEDYIVNNRDIRFSHTTNTRCEFALSSPTGDSSQYSCALMPNGPICQRYNQTYWADLRPTRELETYFAGWAEDEVFDHLRAAQDSLSGTSNALFAAPYRNGYTVPAVSALNGAGNWCASNFPSCPSDTLTSPRLATNWTAGGGSVRAVADGVAVCPKFCLDPTSFEDSYLDAVLAFTQPAMDLFSYLSPTYASDVLLFYWAGTKGDAWVYPFFNTPLGVFFEWDLVFPKMHLAGPLIDPSQASVWSPTYLDALSGQLMITVITPVYVGDYWAGVLAADLMMSQTTQLVENIKPTENGFAVLTYASGDVIAASEATYSALFCPNPDNVACDGDTYSVSSAWGASAAAKGAQGVRMQDTPSNKGTLGAQFLDLTSQSTSGAEVVTFCPASKFGGDAQSCLKQYWLAWDTLDSASTPFKMLLAVPRDELETAAVWSLTQSVVETTFPSLDNVTTSLSNTGTLEVPWKVEAASLPVGVTVTPMQGTLAPGSTVDLSIIFDIAQYSTNSTGDSTVRVSASGMQQACFTPLDIVLRVVGTVGEFQPCQITGCGRYATCNEATSVCQCASVDTVPGPTFVTDRSCIQVLASTDDQRVFWGLSAVFCWTGFVLTCFVLWEFMFNKTLKYPNTLLQSFLAVALPDFVLSATSFVFYLSNLLRGTELEPDGCRVVAFITYGYVIATYFGPVIVSGITLYTLHSASKGHQKNLRAKLLSFILMVPWVTGIGLAAIVFSQGKLGSYRGLYCYNADWMHWSTGLVNAIMFFSATVLTVLFYLGSIFVLAGVAKKSSSRAAAQAPLAVARRGFYLVATFFCTWILFTASGLSTYLGGTRSIALEIVAPLIVNLQPIIDAFVLFSIKSVRADWFRRMSGKWADGSASVSSSSSS